MTDCIIRNNPIPPGRHPQTNVCSDACWHERHRQKYRRRGARKSAPYKAAKYAQRRAQIIGARRASGNFKCVVCGADISHLSSLAEVCSTACAKKKLREVRVIPPPPPFLQPCVECGTVFSSKGFKNILCSAECRGERKKHLRERNHETTRKYYKRNKEKLIEQKRIRQIEFRAALIVARSLIKDQ